MKWALTVRDKNVDNGQSVDSEYLRLYWQTSKPVSVTSLRTAGTHDLIQWSRVYERTQTQSTQARLIKIHEVSE